MPTGLRSRAFAPDNRRAMSTKPLGDLTISMVQKTINRALVVASREKDGDEASLIAKQF